MHLMIRFRDDFIPDDLDHYLCRPAPDDCEKRIPLRTLETTLKPKFFGVVFYGSREIADNEERRARAYRINGFRFYALLS